MNFAQISCFPLSFLETTNSTVFFTKSENHDAVYPVRLYNGAAGATNFRLPEPVAVETQPLSAKISFRLVGQR